MARPLLKKTKGGALKRPPGIETKIDIATAQDWATLSRRARETNSLLPDFLPSECMVHLIRHSIRDGENRIARLLMPQLLKRVEANLERTVPDFRMRDAESVRQEILSTLAMMFTQDGTEGHEDELDFYECRFLRSLRFLRIDHVRSALSDRKELTDLPEASSDQGEMTSDDEMLARLSSMASVGASQEDRVYVPQVVKVLNKLPHDQKRAIVLRRILGYTEKQTATICNVDERTIRYRLAAVDKKIKTLKEDL